MSSRKEQTESTSIVCVEATPAKPTKKEPQAFSTFKAVVAFLQAKMGLAEDFARAKIRREETEAEVKVEEASKIAAETERIRLETMRGMVELIDAHFSEMDDEAKSALKVAVLLNNNPQLKAQVEVVTRMISDLSQRRHTRIEFKDDETSRSDE